MQYVRLAQPGTQQTWMSPLREEPSLSELCCLLEQAEVRIPALNDSQIYGLIQVVLAFTYAVPNLYLALRWKGKLTICRRSGWNQVFAIVSSRNNPLSPSRKPLEQAIDNQPAS